MNIELCNVKSYLEIDRLKVHPENPRTIQPERLDALKKSILKKGFYQPILVWKRGNVILSGNHRFLAVQELMKEGYTFGDPDKNVLPVVIVDCSKEQAMAILFEANNTYAEWVEEELKKALRDVDDYEDYGFTTSFVDSLLKNATKDVEEKMEAAKKEIADVIPEKIEVGDKPEEDEIPKEAKKIISKTGDVWILGDHKIVCGDSTELENFDKLFGKKKKAACAFTSPPYNANTHLDYNKSGNKGLYGKKVSDNKKSEDYVQFGQEVLTNIFTATEGFIFWNVSYSANDRSSYARILQPFLDQLHETIVWEKRPMPVPHGLTRAAELIFCFKNKSKKEHLGEPNTLNYNLWKISNTNAQQEEHKACFPVALPETGIMLSTVEGDIVLDPFMGSGTTIIACEKTKRKAYGIEKEPKFVDLAIQRWEKFTNKKAYLESSGQSFSDIKGK